MSSRCTKVAIFFLLFAGAAFVMVVLSPATETPNADLAAKVLLLLCCILVVLHLLNLPLRTVVADRRSSTGISTRRHPRKLIAWICLLLC